MRFNTSISILLSLFAVEALAAPAPQAPSDIPSASTRGGARGGCKAKIGSSLFGVNRGHRRPHGPPFSPPGEAESAPSVSSEASVVISSAIPSEATLAPAPSVISDIPMPSDQPAPAEVTPTEVQHGNAGVEVQAGRPTQDTPASMSAPNPVPSKQVSPPVQSPSGTGVGIVTGSDDGDGSSLDGFAQAMLKAHNDYRASYNGAVALTWNQTATDQGMNWFKERNCVMEHSGMAGLGENLGQGYKSAAAVVNSWGPGEAGKWSSGDGFTHETGHFTQVVWKDTTSIGCGRTTCGNSNLIFCEYFPAGNVNMAGDPKYFDERVVPS